MSGQYPRTALFGTEERTLFCPTVGREYHLSVALPDGYMTSAQAYPVIYVLDGDFLFGMAAGLTRFSNWFRGVPEAIIVGISYGMESAPAGLSSKLNYRIFLLPQKKLLSVLIGIFLRKY